MSRSFRWTVSEPPSSEDLDPYPATTRPTPPTTPTPSNAKSQFASSGEADSYFTARDGTVGTVDISVTKYYDADDATVDAKSVANRYAQYCEAVDRAFHGIVVRRREKPRATEWIMSHGVLLWVGNPGSIITLYIDAPRMTRLLLEEEAMGLTDYDDILEDD